VKSVENYDYGRKHGTFMFFAEDGTNIGEISYYQDLPHGPFAYRSPLGEALRSGEYYMGKPVGTWLWYYRGGTQLRRQREYVDGYASGKWIEWYENGQIRSEQFYVDSAMVGRPNQKPPYPDGVWQEFYPSGKMKAITTHENFYIASQETYFEDGKLSTRKEYANGTLSKQITYWKTGQNMEERNYAPSFSIQTRGGEEAEDSETNEVLAIREGYTASWYEDGKIRFEGQYKNDKKDGEWRYYDNKKRLIRRTEYKLDVIIKDQTF
jgi:antitoxin component YwqK of YwqJK toxin-antitoxin module